MFDTKNKCTITNQLLITSESFLRERQQPMKEKLTKQTTLEQDDADMLDQYDFSEGVRGKYAERYHDGKNLISLDPDVAKVFPDAKTVNDALRALAKIICGTSEH